MKWYFIRHGQIASNLKHVYSGWSDEELTAAGREQVKQASRQLAELEFDAVYASPLTRTRQTAEIIVDELGRDLPIHLDDSFIEMKMGPWEGRAEAEVAAAHPDEWALWKSYPSQLRLDGRETLAELQQRVLGGMRAIESADREDSILVVTHVAVIRVLRLYADGRSLDEYKSIPVDNAKVFDFPQLQL